MALLGCPDLRGAEPGQKVLRLGFVGPASPSTSPRGMDEMWRRLGELGWVEGQNLIVERRWADGKQDRLPALFAELIALRVDILATYTTAAGIAARKATSTVPIVVAAMGQPIQSGLAQSLARPGGNLTGLSLGWGEGLGGKWLELLQETVPRLSTVAVITSSARLPVSMSLLEELKQAAAMRRLKLRIVEVPAADALDTAFEQVRREAQGVLVVSDPVMMGFRKQIAATATRHRLPALYLLRDYTDAGGLMAYGPELAPLFRRAGDYIDKILRGANPADLPIEQPTKLELVVNLKAAKALPITIPEGILQRADEVMR
jgi:putative ABC transport system substrate-binding protein